MRHTWRAFSLALTLVLLTGMGPCSRTAPDLEPPPVTPDPNQPIVPGPPVK